MKKLFFFLMFLCWLYSFSYASDNIQLIKWIATGDNVKLNFDSSFSEATVDLWNFKQNVCWLGYSWYEISGHVDTETVWYAYFSEDDGDDTVNSCVGLILSWTNWYVEWTGALESDYGDTVYFNKIKLIWDVDKKDYYFSWKAITSSLWEINLFTWVYISWLDLIDWSKTIVDYSNCTGWSVYANWQSCNLKIVLKNSADVEVQSLSSISWEIVLPSWYEDKIFLSTWWDVSKTFSVTNWVVNIPIYFLKPVSWLNLDVKLSYSLPDIDGNSEKTLNLTGIKILNPVKQLGIADVSNNIIWEVTTWTYDMKFYSTGLLDNADKWSFVGTFTITWNWVGKYNFSGSSANQNWNVFSFEIYPKDKNYNQSVVDVTIYTWKVVYEFDSYFNGATGEYTFSLENVPNIRLYANKIVDWSKSFISSTNFSGNTYLTAWTWTIPYFSFILKDHNWYVIPDVKVDVKFKDMWIANSYSSWDCDEITDGYQASCSWLLFNLNWKLFSEIVDNKNWANIEYTVSWSDYKNINIISLKPVTWNTNIYFEIKDIKNTYSWWNFENSWNWIGMDTYSWNLLNLHFLPALKMDFKWINDGDIDYVDINNEIAVYFKNLSSNVIFNNINYKLFWKIVYPKEGVRFSTWYWDILTWNISSVIDTGYTLNRILLSFDYMYDSWVLLNYNSGYISYWINYSWFDMGNLKLKPWYFFYDLNAGYKFLWVFVLWLVNKVQKRSASVKTVLWRTKSNSDASIDVTFGTIYNKLKKKAYFMSQWLSNQLLKISSNVITSLDWWIKYFKCDDTTKTILINWLTYTWENTLLFEDCNVLIKWNLYKGDNKSNLVIFTYSLKDACNVREANYLNNCNLNIYIAENVSDIQAWLLAWWSILTIDGDTISADNIADNVIISNRIRKINDKQLVINWILMWKNTIWWSFLTEFNNRSYFVLPWWYKIDENDSLWEYSDLSDKLKILQIFDANFRRWVKLWTEPDNKGENNWIAWSNYSKDWFSQYCKDNNYPLKCKYSVIFVYDTALKGNRLFK